MNCAGLLLWAGSGDEAVLIKVDEECRHVGEHLGDALAALLLLLGGGPLPAAVLLDPSLAAGLHPAPECATTDTGRCSDGGLQDGSPVRRHATSRRCSG